MNEINKRIEAYRWLKDVWGFSLEEVSWLMSPESEDLTSLNIRGGAEPVDGINQGEGPPVVVGTATGDYVGFGT